MHPLFGVLNGSVTLTGGPATGLAFAPAFEQAGVPGAVDGRDRRRDGRHRLRRADWRADRHDPDRAPQAARAARAQVASRAADCGADRRGSAARAAGSRAPPGEDKESYALLKALVVILVAMWLGSSVSAMVHGRRHHAAGLHRRDARGGGDPQRRRCDRADRAVAARRSTTSAASRCRCSWCWR